MVVSYDTPMTKSEAIELEELLGFDAVTNCSENGVVLDLRPDQVRKLVNALRGPIKKGH